MNKLKIINLENYNAVSVIVFILGNAGLVLVMALDKIYWHTGVFSEGWPDFSHSKIIRSIVIFLFVSAIFWSMIGNNRPEFMFVEKNRSRLKLLPILGAITLSVYILYLFVFEPSTFNNLSLE